MLSMYALTAKRATHVLVLTRHRSVLRRAVLAGAVGPLTVTSVVVPMRKYRGPPSAYCDCGTRETGDDEAEY